MRKLWYLPLEPYAERYTMQLAAPETGWLEKNWIKAGVNYERINGVSLNKEIKVGRVLDACGRGYWSCSQIMQLLEYANNGEIKDGDVIYLDDFWHPGISALPYAFHLLGINPRIFAFCYAQSVDPYDFTHPMKWWMRAYEIGEGKYLEGVFVASTCLKDMLLDAGIGWVDRVHVVGLIFDSEEVRTYWPNELPERERQVIYTSRWDKEKRPDVFLKIAEEVMQKSEIKFVVTTSRKEMSSNDEMMLAMLWDTEARWPGQFIVKEGLSKEEYYYNLLQSRIQINTADQDFISFTLLEATTCGCRPLYPDYLSFPEAMPDSPDLFYPKNNVKVAAQKIMQYIDIDQMDYSWIAKRCNATWLKMLDVMRGVGHED